MAHVPAFTRCVVPDNAHTARNITPDGMRKADSRHDLR